MNKRPLEKGPFYVNYTYESRFIKSPIFLKQSFEEIT